MERSFFILWMLLIFYGCEQKSATYQEQEISAAIDSLKAKNDLAAAYFSSATDSLCLLSDEVIAVSGKLLPVASDSSSIRRIREEMIRAYGNMGKLHGDRGSFAEMAANYLEALRLAEAGNDTLAIIDITGNIGSAYRLSHDRNNAIIYYRQALELGEPTGNLKLISKNYNQLGGVYIDLNQNDSGLFYMRRSLELKLQISDSNGIARVYNNMGMIFSNIGMLDSSLFYFHSAAEIMSTLGDRMAMGIIYDGISGVLREEKQFEAAGRYLDSSMVIAEEIKSDYLKEMVYYSYADLFSKRGDYKNAYEYFVRYNTIIDTIRNANNQQQIADLQNRYEKSKKDLAIFKLANVNNKINAELREQELIRNFLALLLLFGILFTTVIYWLSRKKRSAEQLQRSAEYRSHIAGVEMKALRSQMNTHFIFNTLQSIYDFLVQKQTAMAGEYLLKFSKLMRMILSFGRKPFVTLRDELDALKLYMDLENLRMNNPFTYSIHTEGIQDTDSLKVPSLLLQPLVENSIRHGFSGSVKDGNIRIEVTENDGKLIYRVENRCIVSAMSTPAIKENRESVGLKIVQERLDILSSDYNEQAVLSAQDLSDDSLKQRAYRAVITIPLSILPFN